MLPWQNIVALVMVGLLTVSASRQKKVCQQAEAMYQVACCPDGVSACVPRSHGAPGKRGPPGMKGEPGVAGERGPPGVMDTRKVKSMIGTLERVIEDQNAVIDRLESRLKALEDREGLCFVKYGDRCFWAESLHKGINCNEARRICERRGGSPANIYSREHYDMITTYLRSLILPDGSNIVYLWLGMRADPRTKAITLTDGTPAPYLKWHEGYPSSSLNHVCMGMNVRVPMNAKYQNMYNFPATSLRNGVLCQKD